MKITNDTITGAVFSGATTTATAAGTTTLTESSNRFQRFTGSTTQTVVLPNANTLVVGDYWAIANSSTGTVTVNFNGGSLAATVLPGFTASFNLITASAGAGVWSADILTSTNFGAFSAALTNKTPPVDADTFNIVDSAASNVMKKLTWANLKATLKIGTTTNDSASAGQIGEVISSVVAIGSKVSLTSGAGANITTVSLTAGDWDVQAHLALDPAATTTLTKAQVGPSTVSASIAASIANSATHVWSSTGTVLGANQTTISSPVVRFSLASTTTVYLVGLTTFGVSTLGGYGAIRARRAR